MNAGLSARLDQASCFTRKQYLAKLIFPAPNNCFKKPKATTNPSEETIVNTRSCINMSYLMFWGYGHEPKYSGLRQHFEKNNDVTIEKSMNLSLSNCAYDEALRVPSSFH